MTCQRSTAHSRRQVAVVRGLLTVDGFFLI
jgi:hypothetical protein